MPLNRLITLLAIVIAAAALTVWAMVSLTGGSGSVWWLAAIPIALLAALVLRARGGGGPKDP